MICDTAVGHCRDLAIAPIGLHGMKCLRLAERLEAGSEGS